MDCIVYTCYDRDQNIVKKHITISVCFVSAEMKYVGVTRTTRGVGTPFYDSFPFIDIGEHAWPVLAMLLWRAPHSKNIILLVMNLILYDSL